MAWWWNDMMQWGRASPTDALEAEASLLDRSGVTWSASDERVGPSSEHTMHSITSGGGKPAIVFMPGYAAGAAFYYRNFRCLSQHAQVHLVDWLGTGNSGRPHFPCRSREETEAWFIDALDQWRERKGIDKMVLVGHSLGGYLSSAYALKFPQRVVHLVLVNPAGMAERPAMEPLPAPIRSPFSLLGIVYRVVTQGWSAGITPGVVIRTLGPLSRHLTKGYSQRRLHKTLGVELEEIDAFEPYIFQILNGKGSGEHALRYLLKPFAWATSAMEKRMGDLQPPLTFIYGEHDWIDPAPAERICKNLAEIAEAAGRKQEKFQNEVHFVESGHFPFLEKPRAFDELLLNIVAHQLKGDVPEVPVTDKLGALYMLRSISGQLSGQLGSGLLSGQLDARAPSAALTAERASGVDLLTVVEEAIA